MRGILQNFAVYTGNSIFLALSVMILTLVVTSMAGYVFARKNFRGKELIYGLFVAFMFVNVGSVTLRPLFELAVKNPYEYVSLERCVHLGGNCTGNLYFPDPRLCQNPQRPVKESSAGTAGRLNAAGRYGSVGDPDAPR